MMTATITTTTATTKIITIRKKAVPQYIFVFVAAARTAPTRHIKDQINNALQFTIQVFSLLFFFIKGGSNSST